MMDIVTTSCLPRRFLRTSGSAHAFSSRLATRALDDSSPGIEMLIETRSRCRRSEEHTSELQSLRHLVCRLLLEKKKKNKQRTRNDRRAVGGLEGGEASAAAGDDGVGRRPSRTPREHHPGRSGVDHVRKAAAGWR